MSYLCSKPYLTQRKKQSPKCPYMIGLPILSGSLPISFSLLLPQLQPQWSLGA